MEAWDFDVYNDIQMLAGEEWYNHVKENTYHAQAVVFQYNFNDVPGIFCVFSYIFVAIPIVMHLCVDDCIWKPLFSYV